MDIINQSKGNDFNNYNTFWIVSLLYAQYNILSYIS